ncbi:8-oxo-dGTP diphosphatase [Lapidilactobacillus achengensis]|uniref:8-oxo-dGTP diphosphatase n=1 Tax=Lapidilactobacillus achengensis TaxID=2486000 RepID=A0ABW1ULN4_9LACO|nr:NUDIX domain-containing protein [Lapidilactobacillus achengensis]
MKHEPEPALFLNLVMITKGDQVLVENRVKKDWPGLTFPGGHVEAHEPFYDAAVREMREETGLVVRDLKLVGLCQYPDHTAAGAPFRRVIYFYRTDQFSGTLKSSREGAVTWLDQAELKRRPLAGSLADFLHVFERPELSEVVYMDDASAALFR